MKILLLCNYYHRAALFQYAKEALEKRGHTVHVFNFIPYGTNVETAAGFVRDDSVTHCECFHKRDRFFFFHKQKKIYKALCERLDVKSYDLIHAHMVFSSGYAASRLCRDFGLPFAVSVRNTDINVFWRIPFFTSVARRILKPCTGVHFLSPAYRETFARLYPKAVPVKAVIPSGLDPYYLRHKAQAPPPVPSRCLHILCVGKIDKNKNWQRTLAACRRLIASGWQVAFTAAGPVRNQRIFRMLTRTPFVTCLPFLPKEALVPLYRSHHIFVMPSRTESFGRVYAEAMTQGLPVIYTRRQGFDGLFPDGEIGYAVRARDSRAIAQKVQHIAERYDKMSAQCLARADRFDADALAVRWEQFYTRCLQAGGEERACEDWAFDIS